MVKMKAYPNISLHFKDKEQFLWAQWKKNQVIQNDPKKLPDFRFFYPNIEHLRMVDPYPQDSQGKKISAKNLYPMKLKV